MIYLPLQYALIGLYGIMISEPWPAFALPGFKNVHPTENQTKVIKPYFYAKMNYKNGKYQKVEISEYELFAGIKESQMQGFVRTHFSEPQSFSSDARQWLQDRIEQIHPESKSTELNIVWRESIYTKKEDQLMIESGDEVKVINIVFAGAE